MSDEPYLDDFESPQDLGLELPLLILGPDPRSFDLNYWQPGTSRQWLRIVHQVGGIGCRQWAMHATILTPKPWVLEGMRRLSKTFYDTSLGTYSLRLSDATRYASELGLQLGVRCEETYADLHEGLYPIDLDEGVLGRLCEDALPADLDHLLTFSRDAYPFGRWRLFVLGVNCD